MKQKQGFTLIELLVVIAIIAILAGITFPVFAQVKVGAFKSSDISNMNSIRSALQQYKEDQGGYPNALLGYITPYEFAVGVGNIVPAEQLVRGLYPKRVNSISILKPALSRVSSSLVTAALWPQSAAVGNEAFVDVNADGVIDASDNIPPAFASSYPNGPYSYFYDITGSPLTAPLNCTDTATGGSVPRLTGGIDDSAADGVGAFYAISGYDVSPVAQSSGSLYELRYARFWSDAGTCRGGGADDPRQLGYNDPPETTVITWNSYFRNATSVYALPIPGQSKDIVLQLGGSARAVDSALMNQRTWRFNR